MAVKQRIVTPEMAQLLSNSGSRDVQVAYAALRELAVALELPLKQGVLNGSIIEGIFETINFLPGQSIEFPLDWLTPGSEDEHIAYTIPAFGALPEKRIQGDFLMISTYEIGQTIDWLLKYARDARWDIVGRAMRVLEAGFVRKRNNDAMHVILAAGKSRNLVVYDEAATAGLFTKRLIELMKISMRRNSGGNSTSTNQGMLTDVFLSPEAWSDRVSWDLTQVPDALRAQFFMGSNNVDPDVKFHSIDELGVGQEYQDYFVDVLGGTMPSDKVEIVIGLDLRSNDSFVRPVRETLKIYDRPELFNQRRAGVQGVEEGGWGSLDNRRVIIAAL